MDKPLSGTRVLDFSRVMAGPFCTSLMADTGAEVIKVESPHGDDYRNIGPFQNGESALFMLMNKGKKSIVLDLKSDAGMSAVKRLIEKSDVIVENFRPGVTKRLGIDYEAAKAINPKIVYLSISGFGQEGPMSHRPAYDLIAQAMAGMMSVTGEADRPPMRVGDALGDLATGLFGAWAVTTALLNRDRTGAGNYLDVAMFDSIFSLLPTPLSVLLYGGGTPGRNGNHHLISTPFGSFQAKNGHVIIAIANNKLFHLFAEAIGRVELSREPRFETDEMRTKHKAELCDIIESWSKDKNVKEVVDLLDGVGIPASPIWSIDEAANSSHVAFRKLFVPLLHPIAGDTQVIEQPVHFSSFERGDITPSPVLGAHTEQVLRDIAELSTDDISKIVGTAAL